MARCKDITPPKRKLCIGALRSQVDLYSRALTSPAFESQANRQSYTLVDTIRAAVQTVNGIDIFDGVEVSGANGVPKTATILFYARYRTDVTAENFLQHEGVNYQVLQVEDIDLRHKWMKLFAATRGDITLPAAL